MVLLPVDKYESFLQGDSILDVCKQACLKCPKNKFAMSLQCLKENRKNEFDFLFVGKHQKFLQNDTTILGFCVQACPNYPK